MLLYQSFGHFLRHLNVIGHVNGVSSIYSSFLLQRRKSKVIDKVAKVTLQRWHAYVILCNLFYSSFSLNRSYSCFWSSFALRTVFVHRHGIYIMHCFLFCLFVLLHCWVFCGFNLVYFWMRNKISQMSVDGAEIDIIVICIAAKYEVVFHPDSS